MRAIDFVTDSNMMILNSYGDEIQKIINTENKEEAIKLLELFDIEIS